MRTVDQILDDVLGHEGGYTEDHAGPTMHGVSLRYAEGIGLDLDGDGDTDKDDILQVTPEVARDLYKRDFFSGPGIDKLPAPLHPVMVDFAVNSGAPRAIMCLQDVVNQVRESAPELGIDQLYADGRMGPKTRKACEVAYEAMGGYLVNAVCDAREAFMRDLARINPGRFAQYVTARDGGPGGWIKRARSFRVEV